MISDTSNANRDVLKPIISIVRVRSAIFILICKKSLREFENFYNAHRRKIIKLKYHLNIHIIYFNRSLTNDVHIIMKL